MNPNYCSDYAKFFDTIYDKKDYDKDTILKNLEWSESDKNNKCHRCDGTGLCRREILDLGCGTGRNSEELIKNGFEIYGVDQSESMLKVALEKFPKHHWINSSIENFEIDRAFRNVIMLGDIISYCTTNTSVTNALSNIRKHMLSDAVLLFDMWYGPAVLTQQPKTSSVLKAQRKETKNDYDIQRKAVGHLDTINNLCIVDYTFNINGEEFAEQHIMRYFSKPEMKLLLDMSGFQLMKFGSMYDIDKEPTIGDWHVLATAKLI